MSIRSMTGYGQGAAELPGLQLTVELRTINNRFVDLRFRLPPALTDFERDVRRKILAHVRRGRVELSLNFERSRSPENGPALDRQLVNDLVAARRVLREEYGISGELDLATVLAFPGIMKHDGPELTWGEAERAALETALDSALQALDEDRAREGEQLRTELLGRLDRMGELTAALRERLQLLPDGLRNKLQERLKALAGELDLDPARIAQEAVYLADRSDVTEEIVRLEGHLAQTRALLEEPDGEPVGKRIEFLVQEIHRETNTINSKPADLELSRTALELKAETEKVREQIQNIE